MIRPGRRNRLHRAIHLDADILIADQPQVNLPMSAEREREFGRPDRVERDEAANVSTGMPAPDANTPPSTIPPSLVGRRIVDGF